MHYCRVVDRSWKEKKNRHKICEFIYSMTCKLQSFIHSNRKIITTSPKDYTQISHRFTLTLQKQLFAAKTFSSSPSRQASPPSGLSTLSVMEKPLRAPSSWEPLGSIFKIWPPGSLGGGAGPFETWANLRGRRRLCSCRLVVEELSKTSTAHFLLNASGGLLT